jgi:tRNA nucleotidyltransferase (CCA-adding enzyme)
MSDYNFLLEIRLTPPQLLTLNHISRIAAGLGLNIYLAGGAVRDITLGQTPLHNLDFVTEGNVQKLFQVIEREGKSERGRSHAQPAHPHGQVEVEHARFDAHRQGGVISFSNGVDVEITRAHREVYSKPGRPPQIVPSGVFEDLRGRDFSANAMAISLHPNSRGLLLDPTNGAADIENRELRALSSRCFLDDPARIYRLLRLSLRLGFKVEPRTEAWLEAAIEGKLWQLMAPAQQGHELRATLQEDNPARILKDLESRGLLVGLDPALSRIRLDRLEKVRSIARSQPGGNLFVLYFDSLVETLPPAQRKRLAEKVMPEPNTLRLALGLEGEASKLARTLGSGKALAPSAAVRILDAKPYLLLLYVLLHYPQDRIQKWLKHFLTKVPQIRARLPRAELQALGVEPGPRFEKIMDQLLADVLDGKVKSPPQLTKKLRELAGVPATPPPVPPAPARRVLPKPAAKPKPGAHITRRAAR